MDVLMIIRFVNRYEILSHSVNRIQEDGLNNVKYKIISITKNPIYTNITADVGTAVIECKSYLSDWTCGFVMWMCEHLTLSCGMLQYNSTDDGTLTMPLDLKAWFFSPTHIFLEGDIAEFRFN